MQAAQQLLVLQADIRQLERKKGNLLAFLDRTGQQLLEARSEVAEYKRQKQQLYTRIRILLSTISKLEAAERGLKTPLQKKPTA